MSLLLTVPHSINCVGACTSLIYASSLNYDYRGWSKDTGTTTDYCLPDILSLVLSCIPATVNRMFQSSLFKL